MQRIVTTLKLATVTVLLVLLFSMAGKSVGAATPTDLFISEYIEGGSFNKAIEIYNGTGAAVDLAAGSYVLQFYNNAATSPTATINLTGTVADSDVFVVADDNSNPAILALTDLQSTVSFYNGDDAIVLRKGGASGTIIDSIGQVGVQTIWGSGDVTTQNDTLRRKSTVCAGDTDPTDAYDTTEWDGFPEDNIDDLGGHTADCDVTPVINEFVANHAGADTNEYIEVFGAANTDYSDLTVLVIEGDAPSTGSIDRAYPVGTTDANGFWTTGFLDNQIENGTLTLLLVKGFSGATGNDLDTDDDGTLNATPWTDILDSVAVSDGGSSDLTYASSSVLDPTFGGGFTPGGASRIPNGVDTDTTSDWMVNDFDGAGIPTFVGTPASGEALNTPGTINEEAGDGAPTVSNTIPADNATGVAANANIDITFSEAVDVTGSWFTISCDSSGAHTATVSGGPTTFTLDPNSDFTDGESCTVTIIASQVSDQDDEDPPDTMAADYVFDFEISAGSACGNPATLISAIQGSGLASSEDGNIHTIEGVVVGDFQAVPGDNSELNGFFVQEEDGDVDLDPTTSEGIFVFDGSSPAVNVALGDVVRVTGTVDEFNGLTELTSVTNVEICSSGASVTAVEVSLPLPSADFLEQYEGMAVVFPQQLFVTETFALGRFGEVLLSSGGVLPHPTQVAEPGPAANAQAAANDLNKILLDDGYTNQNPDPLIYPHPGLTASNTLRGGDTVTGLEGVLHFAFNVYRVQPVGTVEFEQTNPRPTTAPDVGGSLTVASFNVLNYFTGIDTIQEPSSGPDDPADNTCGPAANQECRGADTIEEFERQEAKIIAALEKLNADVVGLIEIENNGDTAVSTLVDALNDALGSDEYDYIATGNIGTDAIKVALIYKIATVEPVGDPQVLNSAHDPRFIDTLNRPMLVQTFKEISSDEIFTVAVNHLKSKGSDCNGVGDPDIGDEQGNCNLTRLAAAEAIVDFLESDPTGSGDPDFLIIGDLNSYAMEDPIQALEEGGYTNLLAHFQGITEHTYVFDGEWGNLDHALASQALFPQVTGAASYHINADEPPVLDYNVEFKSADQFNSFYDGHEYRSSDHDAVVVGLNLGADAGSDVELYVTTQGNGTVDGISYTSQDILHYDGSEWSIAFDGSAYGLTNKHDLYSIHVDDPTIYLTLFQNKVAVPGLGQVTGHDILYTTGSTLGLVFDGSDVGLTTTAEKIDGLHILPGDVSLPGGGSCLVYLLISTFGTGKVPAAGGGQLKFQGEDVLGFCVTSGDQNTSGTWHMVLDGSAEGMPKNATFSLSASDDGQVLYLTTKDNFHVDSADGSHSEVYRYDIATGEFSGPFFSAPATGLLEKVTGLHVAGELP